MSTFGVGRYFGRNFEEGDNCPICFESINPLLGHRLGKPVIHQGPNGAKHPMHDKCLKAFIASHNTDYNQIVNCPICRDRISFPQPKNILIDKIAEVFAFTIVRAPFYGIISYFTGNPLLGALIPSVFLSIRQILSLIAESTELGLQRPLATELRERISTSALLIGVPLAASIATSQSTDSIFWNSIISQALGSITEMQLGIDSLM